MTHTILVVEDEAIIAEDIRGTLQQLGYAVPTPVASGEEALAAVRAARPDLVLMDIKLQGSIDGIAAAQRLRDEHGLPVVFLTSHSDEATLARAKLTQPSGYVLKPFTDRELRTTIEVALHRFGFETQLTERQHWFATTLESIGDAVIATDHDERVTFMNRLAETLTGWRFEAAAGRQLSAVLRLVDESGAAIEPPLRRALRGRYTAALPSASTLVERGAQRIAVDDRAAPVVDARGRLLGGVAVFRDVTERVRLERRLGLAERLASIGAVAAGMARELNNPLTTVTANLAVAREHVDELRAALGRGDGGATPALADAALEELGSVLDDAARGAEQVRQQAVELKRFSRLEHRGPTAVVDLPEVLDAALRLTDHGHRHGARVIRSYGTTPYVEASEGQLTQVFLTLLVNSAEAVGAGRDGDDEIRITTRTDADGNAVVEVADTGCGIPAEELPRVFDGRHRPRPSDEAARDSGLGLAVARTLITALGGAITVESEEGRGAVFRVTLPPAAGPPRPRSGDAAGATARRGRVLVIDDEPALAHSVERVLRARHDVTVQTDPRAALSLLLDGEEFDLILCDLMMPGLTGMDLYDALARVRPAAAQRVVFLTGGAASPHARAFLDATTNPCVAKPFSVEALRALAADYVQ